MNCFVFGDSQTGLHVQAVGSFPEVDLDANGLAH
jgi:hypothetical protein